MKNIVIIGSGGHAKVILDIIEKQNEYNILGLIDNFKNKGNIIFGYEIIGKIEDLKKLNNIYGGVVAIGDNWRRYKVVKQIHSFNLDFQFITAIHPFTALAKDVEVGEGTVIMAGAIINSASIIGKHCIINTKASVDHDNNIGDFVMIAPKATTGGNVNIGNYSAILLGANVIHNINIGKHSVIGAGSTVLRDIPPYTVAYGIPARLKRKRKNNEKYL